MFTPGPSLDEVLTVRHESQPTVRHVMASLTDEQLASEVTPAPSFIYPATTRRPPRSGPTRRPTLLDATDDWRQLREVVNGFVNETQRKTQRNCRDGLERDVMAWTGHES